MGYQQACDENWANSDVSITRHTHVDSCYCLGNVVVSNKLGSIGSGTNKYYIEFRCSSCGATGRANSNINWYDSKNVGDVEGKHLYTYLAWTSGQQENKKCAYEDNQVVSVKINGVEYIN